MDYRKYDKPWSYYAPKDPVLKTFVEHGIIWGITIVAILILTAV